MSLTRATLSLRSVRRMDPQGNWYVVGDDRDAVEEAMPQHLIMCPFCDAYNAKMTSGHTNASFRTKPFRVECPVCKTRGPFGENEDVARRKWLVALPRPFDDTLRAMIMHTAADLVQICEQAVEVREKMK
jgi:hypothetical protein